MDKIKELIQKEFLPLLLPHGFVYYKNNLIIAPVNDLLKGFCFDRHDSRLYVHLFIQPLYIPAKYQSLDYGWRLKGSHPSGDMFWLDDERIEYTKSELATLMLAQKDILLETKTALDFYNKFLVSDIKLLAYKTSIDIRYQQVLTYTKSYTHPDETCTLVDQFLITWGSDNRNKVSWMQEIKNDMLLLRQACISKEKVESKFKEWKNFTMANLKLLKSPAPGSV